MLIRCLILSFLMAEPPTVAYGGWCQAGKDYPLLQQVRSEKKNGIGDVMSVVLAWHDF